MERDKAYDPRDFTIHLRDLVLYVLVRWRLWLSAALAGAILLTLWRYVDDVHRYRMGQTAPAPLTALSADARARVASAMGYQAAYQRVCAYNETAPLMHIDPGAAPTRRMRLLVTGEGCWTAACLYREHVVSESLYREMADETTRAADLAELVTVEVECETTQQTARRVFLTMQVLAPTEELCNRLSAAVRQAVEDAFADVAAAAGPHGHTWAFDRYAVLRDETVATRQQASLEQQTALQEKHAAAHRALTADERAYIQRLMGQTTDAAPATPPVIHRTAWLWGFLLGGGAGVLLLAVRYLFCGRVLSAADAVSRHGVAVIGVLGGDKRRFARLRDAAEDGALVWQRLAVSAATQGVTRLYLSVPAAQESRLAGWIPPPEKRSVAVSVGGSPATDGGAAQAFSACDGLVVACVCGATAHRDVAAQVALAKQWGIPVVGLLLLQ